MLEDFADAVVVVTGGASGIGRGIAEEVAARGARVVVSDVNDARLAEVGKALTDRGIENLTAHCDVTNDAGPNSDGSQASAGRAFACGVSLPIPVG